MVFYDLSTMSLFNQNYPAFAENTLGKTPFIILVYADFCSHCVKMKPDWNTAVKNHSMDTPITQIENDVFQHLTNNHKDNLLSQIMQEGVQGFPFIATVGPMNKTGKIDVTESDQQRSVEGFGNLMTKIKKVKATTPKAKSAIKTKTAVKLKAPKAVKAKSVAKPKVKAHVKAKAPVKAVKAKKAPKKKP